MCKKREAQEKAIDELYLRLQSEVVCSIKLLFNRADNGTNDLVGLFCVTNGTVGNFFIVHDDGSLSFDGSPIRFVSGIGNRGIANMFGCDFARAI